MQTIVFLDEAEEAKIDAYKKKHDIGSKNEVIKEIIMKYVEAE